MPIYQNFQSLCEEQNIVDFEDLIFMTIRMLTRDEDILSRIKKRYQYVFIDEYQDLNFGQYELVKLLFKNSHIVAIGDPDQSIYGFRGSDNKYFKSFTNDFPGCEKILLNRNYRSTQTILDASFQMITKTSNSKETSNSEVCKIFSDIRTEKKLILKETATEYAEAVAIGRMIEKFVGGTSFFSMDAGKINPDEHKEYAFSDFAILYRTSRQCETFIKVFEKEGIPFQAADTKNIYDIDGIKQVLSFCRIINNSASFLDFEIAADHFEQKTSSKNKKSFLKKKMEEFYREIKDCDNATSIRMICEKTGLKQIIEKNDKTKLKFDQLLSIAENCSNLKTFLDYIALNQDVDTIEYDTQKVSLLTMHAAKGLEFPIVFVAGCEQGLIPFVRKGKNGKGKNRDDKNIDDIEEERRLFYVAMTRAMDILCLSYAKKRNIYGVNNPKSTNKNRQRSIFIDDIENSLTQIVKSHFFVKPVKKAKQLEMFE